MPEELTQGLLEIETEAKTDIDRGDMYFMGPIRTLGPCCFEVWFGADAGTSRRSIYQRSTLKVPLRESKDLHLP